MFQAFTAIWHPFKDLWRRHCVRVLECEQSTLAEKSRGKYQGEKTVHIHVYLRLIMFLLNR